MAEAVKAISALLDEMAVKILMVEPGDLSVVGELVVLVEELVDHDILSRQPVLHQMAQEFQAAVEKIIMGEVSDAAGTYDVLGQCLGVMQEEERRPGQPDPARIKQFCELFATIGYHINESVFTASDEKAASVQEPKFSEESPAETNALAEDEISLNHIIPPEKSIQQQEQPATTSKPDLDFLQDTDLLKGFIEESFDHLDSIEENILELEQKPDDADIINNIFRPFHTIKGVSGFLNLKNINKLAHTTENLLDDVRNGRRTMDSDVIEVVLSVGDYLRAMVENVQNAVEKGPDHYQEMDISEYITRVTEVAGGESTAPAPKTTEQEEAVEITPPEKPIVQDKIEDFQDLDVDAIIPADDSDDFDQEIPADAAPPVQESETVAPKEAPTVPEPKKEVAATKPPQERPAPSQPASKSKIGDSIKVDIEKLDSLVNAMGELVIMQSLIQQNPKVASINDPKLARDFSQLSRIITDLQKTAMSMRMVPIRQTFQKMVRLVRDLSKKTGKEVDLVMAGEDTEIDRNMVDSIYDPLVHMMRNSVDHGVQVPEERVKNGKPRQGAVHLRAYQKGSNIVIEIEDDGEGLDPEKLKRKAIERGLVSDNEALTDQEAINLIMMAGFSTAEKITDVSGRGVGMDVVKKAVEKLRGKVEISSQPGKGCIFTIRLPLTLAIIEGIVVQVGQERYIIPTVAIQESIRPSKEHYSTVHGKSEALMVRGKLVPIIRLYEVFREKTSKTDPFDAIVVVVEYEGQRRALMVDELLGKQEVVIKSLGGYMKNIKGVAGGTILGDGRVGLILDLAGLIAYADTMPRIPVSAITQEITEEVKI